MFVVGAVYYFAYGKNKLVAKTADEELALILDAESDLEEDSAGGLSPKSAEA